MKADNWILCTESLPVELDDYCSDNCLLTMKEKDDPTEGLPFVEIGYYDLREKIWRTVSSGGIHEIDEKLEVVAWMPVPEPYKE